MSSTTAQLAIQAAKWKSDPPTEDEKKEFLKTTIKDLENPEMATEVSKNLEGLAVTAVKTDEAFDKVGRYFKNFVDQSGKDFPGLAGYLTQWTGHQNRWRQLVTQSRDLAVETASNYQDYDEVLLKTIEHLETKEDMIAAAKELEKFSQEKPAQVPADMAKRFGDLKTDVELFQRNFYQYLDDQKTIIDKEAEKVKQNIDALKRTIDELTAGIAVALGFIGVGAWWNLVLSALAGVAIIGLAIARKKATDDLANQQAELAEINRKQEALAHIKSDFDGLTPDFKLICDSLQIFTDIWNEFHKESLEFADELRKLPDAKYPEIFKLRIELARKTAAPLRQGLKTYAGKIHL